MATPSALQRFIISRYKLFRDSGDYLNFSVYYILINLHTYLRILIYVFRKVDNILYYIL